MLLLRRQALVQAMKGLESSAKNIRSSYWIIQNNAKYRGSPLGTIKDDSTSDDLAFIMRLQSKIKFNTLNLVTV